MPSQQHLQTVGQDDTQYSDKKRCKERKSVTLVHIYQLITNVIFSHLQDELTNNSSRDIDNVPRGLCRDLSIWAEEQFGGEGLSEGPVLHLRAVVVTTVLCIYGHLLPFHQLHQLLCLAGRAQGAWLVPAEAETCESQRHS